MSQVDPNSKVTLKIPRPLYEKIGQVIEGSGYNSVTDFVVYVLRDLIATHRADRAATAPDEVQQVKKRLQSMGYL